MHERFPLYPGKRTFAAEFGMSFTRVTKVKAHHKRGRRLSGDDLFLTGCEESLTKPAGLTQTDAPLWRSRRAPVTLCLGYTEN